MSHELKERDAFVSSHLVVELRIAILLRIARHNFLFDRYERTGHIYNFIQNALVVIVSLIGGLGFFGVDTTVVTAIGAIVGAIVIGMEKLKGTLQFSNIRSISKEQHNELERLLTKISDTKDVTVILHHDWERELAAINANDGRMSSNDRAAFTAFCKNKQIPYIDHISRLQHLLNRSPHTVVLSNGRESKLKPEMAHTLDRLRDFELQFDT